MPFRPHCHHEGDSGEVIPRFMLRCLAGRLMVFGRSFLLDRKHFLFYATSKDPQNNATYAATLDGGEPKLLVRGDSNAVYASQSAG